MKRNLLLVCALFLGLSISLQAQAPQAIQYQTIIRDGDGVVVMNQDVSLQFTILRGPQPGTEVYQETHMDLMTNAFGLVNLQIGMGTPASGTLKDNVDWSMGPYHLEVGLDLANGSNYTVMGTTQLLSVPFALYAETAGNSGATLPAGGTEGQTLKIVGGVPTWVDPIPQIGDFVGDGIIFYLLKPDDPGYVMGETHGLIVSLDESEALPWCPLYLQSDPVSLGLPSDPETEAGARIGDGSSNTDGMITECPLPNSAAQWCRDKGPEWFLPSRGELNELYKWWSGIDKAAVITVLESYGDSGLDGTYWSSTRITSSLIAIQDLSAGGQDAINFENVIGKVRAMRAF